MWLHKKNSVLWCNFICLTSATYGITKLQGRDTELKPRDRDLATDLSPSRRKYIGYSWYACELDKIVVWRQGDPKYFKKFMETVKAEKRCWMQDSKSSEFWYHAFIMNHDMCLAKQNGNASNACTSDGSHDSRFHGKWISIIWELW